MKNGGQSGALQAICKLELPEIKPILGSEKTIRYRNKLEYTFSNRRYLLREELGDPQISALIAQAPSLSYMYLGGVPPY